MPLYTAAGQENEIKLKDLEVGKSYKLKNAVQARGLTARAKNTISKLAKRPFKLVSKEEIPDPSGLFGEYILKFNDNPITRISSLALPDEADTLFVEMEFEPPVPGAPALGGKRRKTRNSRKTRKLTSRRMRK